MKRHDSIRSVARGRWAAFAPRLFCLLPAMIAVACDANGAPSAQGVRTGDFSGFSVDHANIPTAEIRSGGPAKDGIPALTDPAVLPAQAATYLATADRVIGVEIAGETRAYPLRILDYHECVNDTVGGVPVAITYCPLCDSALVFDRRVGGRTREFGISGLLYQSNVLLYDRQPDDGDESLWSQILRRAVTGAAAAEGLQLRLLDATLTTWGAWGRKHPATTVLSAKTGFAREYSRRPYASYFNRDDTMFPVSGRTLARQDLRNKDRVVVVTTPGGERAYAVPDLMKAPGRRIEDRIGNIEWTIVVDEVSGEVNVMPREADRAAPPIVRSYELWFAWDAVHPDGDLYRPPTSESDDTTATDSTIKPHPDIIN
jgi:hypothetical protein